MSCSRSASVRRSWGAALCLATVTPARAASTKPKTGPPTTLVADEPGRADTEVAAPKSVGIQGQIYLGFPSTYDTFRIGALLRASYVLSPRIVASARTGYVYGFPQSVTTSAPFVDTSGAVSSALTTSSWSWNYVPVLLGGRYYFSPARDGFHADAELGIYAGWVNVSGAGYDRSFTDTRPALNLGAGYIVSGSIPLDVMLEWSGYAGFGASLGVKLN